STSLMLLYTLKGSFGSMTWSPDGKQFASISKDVVHIWDSTSGSLLHTLFGHKREVFRIVWSPDGKKLASTSFDHTMRIWSPTSGKLLHSLSSHTLRGMLTQLLDNINPNLRFANPNDPEAAEWSPDSRLLAAGFADYTVQIWDSVGGKLLYILSGHTDWV